MPTNFLVRECFYLLVYKNFAVPIMYKLKLVIKNSYPLPILLLDGFGYWLYDSICRPVKDVYTKQHTLRMKCHIASQQDTCRCITINMQREYADHDIIRMSVSI